jgi:hypothetical protein
MRFLMALILTIRVLLFLRTERSRRKQRAPSSSLTWTNLTRRRFSEKKWERGTILDNGPEPLADWLSLHSAQTILQDFIALLRHGIARLRHGYAYQLGGSAHQVGSCAYQVDGHADDADGHALPRHRHARLRDGKPTKSDRCA